MGNPESQPVGRRKRSRLARRGWSSHQWVRTFISWLAAASLRLLGRTWRVTIEGDADLDGDANHLAGFWHRDLIVAAYLFRDRGFCAPVSRSGDGDLIASMLAHLNYAEVPRGSSSRGGASALLSCVRLMRQGRTLSVQTDGPRGPARESKIGIATISRLAQVPITPVSFSANPCFRFPSWDGLLLPLPFARVTCRYGDRLGLARDADPAAEADLCRKLDVQLNVSTSELDSHHGLAASPG
jgi:lysophospholipid acyltransferase (LPLAT)-like uncharacterized protein